MTEHTPTLPRQRFSLEDPTPVVDMSEIVPASERAGDAPEELFGPRPLFANGAVDEAPVDTPAPRPPALPPQPSMPKPVTWSRGARTSQAHRPAPPLPAVATASVGPHAPAIPPWRVAHFVPAPKHRPAQPLPLRFHLIVGTTVVLGAAALGTLLALAF